MIGDQHTSEQRGWVDRDAQLWSRAVSIVANRPGLDVEGVYHVLRNLERSPSERLQRALSFGRFRPERA